MDDVAMVLGRPLSQQTERHNQIAVGEEVGDGVQGLTSWQAEGTQALQNSGANSGWQEELCARLTCWSCRVIVCYAHCGDVQLHRSAR